MGEDDKLSDYTESSDEEERRFLKEKNPFFLREKGNNLMKNGDYAEANEAWLQSVKETLKLSVRTPSAELYENQIICRLNLALGNLKLGQWVEAKEQANLVLEQRPNNVKALYRQAQALERLQDWTACEESLQLLQNEVDRYRDEAANVRVPEESSQPGLGSFTPEEIEKLIKQMEQRIKRERLIYQKKSRTLYQGIGQRLNEVGAAESRGVPDKDFEKTLGMTVESEEGKALRLVGHDVSSCIKWRYNDLEEEDLNKGDHRAEAQARLLKGSAVVVLKDSEEGDRDVDNPKNSMWTQPHDLKGLLKDKRCVNLALPFTIAHFISLCLKGRKYQKETPPFNVPDCVTQYNSMSTQVEADMSSEGPASSQCFSEADVTDMSPGGKLKRRLATRIFIDRKLRILVGGARGDGEMECEWTSLLRRVPMICNLEIIFVGFLDKNDRWSDHLKEGVLSPPLVKTKGLLSGQKLTCRLFKGAVQLFFKIQEGILSDPLHTFHPDFVVIPDPGLNLYFDSWISIFDELVINQIPTLVTGYSAKDFASHEAQALPEVIRGLGGKWAIPLQPNFYPISVQPEAECPPMKLWSPPGSPSLDYSGISSKHAVIGCFLGLETQRDLLSESEIAKLKKSLQFVCDVGHSTEELMKKELSESELENSKLKTCINFEV